MEFKVPHDLQKYSYKRFVFSSEETYYWVHSDTLILYILVLVFFGIVP